MNAANQMNSMYQSPLQQNNSHKSSLWAMIIFLIIAIIVAVLGFGRIGALKDEDAAARQAAKQAAEASMKKQQADNIDVFAEINTTIESDSKSDTDKIDQEFK